MHASPSSALPVGLLSLLLLTSFSMPMVSAMISDRSICVRRNAAMLAEAAACGDRIPLQRCLQRAPNFVTLDDLQRCYIDVDCTMAEAASEAMIILKSCDASGSPAEMRRRTGPPEATPAAATRTPAPVLLDNKDESPASSTTTATTSTSPATTTPARLARPSECSTARTIKTTDCPITSLGKDEFSTLPCTSTTLTTMECAATNICFDDDDDSENDTNIDSNGGGGGCKFREDSLRPSGVVVTVLLSIAVVAVVGVLLFFYARDRKARRIAAEKVKSEKQEEALRMAEAARKEYAKAEMERERLRHQRREARRWASRRAMEGRRGRGEKENPFVDGGRRVA
ncbi:hypothetical protein F5Y14DRAFT_24062 [Nemania sp. NC0429]|nr:hypothetical protein F5Y14DRAFT_24062 [Nemania sp. NC0429]